MDAGGFELLDQKHFATDLPMTSVTLFQGETNALAHTFNYWTPTGPYQAIQGIIEEFIAQVFP